LYVFPRTRAWLASISDEAVEGEHLSAPLSDRSTPSPNQLSANSTPPPADEAAKDTHKTACLDATSVESNDAVTCAPTTLENKSRQELQSDESYHVRSNGRRAPPSTPTLVEEEEQFASDDDCDDDDDLSSWSSEVTIFSLPHICYLKRGMQPVISGEGTQVKNFLQGTPAHEEIDADFIYGPQLPEIDFALSDDEISEQVSYRTNACVKTESNTCSRVFIILIIFRQSSWHNLSGACWVFLFLRPSCSTVALCCLAWCSPVAWYDCSGGHRRATTRKTACAVLANGS